MSKSNVAISGCGISYLGYDQWPTWTKLIKATGIHTNNFAGPAVSNSYIVNSLLKTVLQAEYTHVICQLTTCGKLDVFVDTEEKLHSMVVSDHVRNSLLNSHGKIINHLPGIWPSSHSIEHPAKDHWANCLHSDAYETHNLVIALNALAEICKFKNIKLLIFEGYPIEWESAKLVDPELRMQFMLQEKILYPWYQGFCVEHGLLETGVPGLEFQFLLAEHILECLDESDKIERLRKLHKYFKSILQ